MVFGLTSDDPLPDDSEATEMIYFNYLKTHLTFPFLARFSDPITSCKHEATVLGMCDDFRWKTASVPSAMFWPKARRSRCLCRNWKSNRMIPIPSW